MTLAEFCEKLGTLYSHGSKWNIDSARKAVAEINSFLYTNYNGIGQTRALEKDYEYFSDFHKYWERYHEEILNCQIQDDKCAQVAEALHKEYLRTSGSAFSFVSEEYKNSNLNKEVICRIRLLTANQDFRKSMSFSKLAEKYNDDPSKFDEQNIYLAPDRFLTYIGINKLSQNDKRVKYAKKIAEFILNATKNYNDDKAYHLIDSYNYDLLALRKNLIKANAGYGEKKTDMVLRDMVVLGIWDKDKVRNFDKLNVASDVNTIKVALRTGIISTAIPLVSSFLDIFCYQYSYMDAQNAQAWRRVWEIWRQKYPQDEIGSPCLLDFFVYNVVGRQFCKINLYKYECETGKHTFYWHSSKNRTCQTCYKNHRLGVKAHLIDRVMACRRPADESQIAIGRTKYVENLPDSVKNNYDFCPFHDICEHTNLMPPKSISILGQTGWNSAYSRKGDGGGGLMS